MRSWGCGIYFYEMENSVWNTEAGNMEVCGVDKRKFEFILWSCLYWFDDLHCLTPNDQTILLKVDTGKIYLYNSNRTKL